MIANELRAVPEGVDAEFESLGKEQGAGRITRALRYERLLLRLSRNSSFSGLFAHMCPVYANLASPILRPRGMRVILWFAHPTDSWQLAAAERLSNAVLTSLPGAYPRKSPKVTAIGQAIDTELWQLVPPPPASSTLRVVALGRTSPVKGYPVLLEAVKLARENGTPVRLRVVGPSTTAAEARHRNELHRLVDNLELGDAVEFVDGVPPEVVRAIVAEADLVVNATRAGSGDKTIFEAMASGRPVLVSNPAFAELLDELPAILTFPDGDAEVLASRLTAIAALPTRQRETIGRRLRERVVRGHSVASWADEVVAAVADVSRVVP